MSSSISKKQTASTAMPRRTIQGHTSLVQGVVHLPGGQRIVTCSDDGSLRVRDLESGAQIGEEWQDEGDNEGVKAIALSPNGKIIATGSNDGKVRLWDIETGKVTAKWAGHTENVLSVYWSASGKRVLSGSSDGTARAWDVMSGKDVLAIETGHIHVWAGIYSPDETMFATGGYKQHGIKIWDAKNGKLIATLQHNRIVFSLAWTSDGKKLISTSYGPITIFSTATWREIAILEGHTNAVWAISLSCNNRLLASASDDKTVRLWDLNTNLPVGLPLHHEHEVACAAFSADFGKVLVTGCEDKNVYVWDVHAILKESGLEDFLRDITVTARKSLNNSSATPRHANGPPGLPQGFFDVLPQQGTQSSATRRIHPGSPAQHPRSTLPPFLARILSFLRSSLDTDDTSQLVLPVVEVPAIKGKARNESAQTPKKEKSHGQGSSTTPPVPGVNTTTRPLHSRPRQVLARLVLLLCCVSSQHTDDHAQPTQQQEGQSQGQVQAQESSPQTQPAAPSTSATPPSSSRSDGPISRLFSLFRSQRHTNEDIPHVVVVAAMEDKGALFVAGRPQPDLSQPPSAGTATPGARPVHPLTVRLLGHLALFLCCVCNHQKTDSNPQPTQQQEGQSQDQLQTHTTSLQTQQQKGQTENQDHAQASSSQTQPAAPLISATPTLSLRPDALISRMSLLFRPETHANEEIELTELPSRPHFIEVVAV